MTDEGAPVIPAVVRGTASLDELAAIAASLSRPAVDANMERLSAWRQRRRAAVAASLPPAEPPHRR